MTHSARPAEPKPNQGGKEAIPSLWLAGLTLGMKTFASEPILGLKRVILPLTYWRSAEFAYVFRQLRASATDRILDLGSPKDLALFLARHKGCEVVAVDILPEAVELARRYVRASGYAPGGPGGVLAEVQDGRALPYPTDSFSAAYSVSVLEHIPGPGDSEAMLELMRVVRPGGLVVITVPFDRRYRETFVDRDVYERSQVNREPVFYQRHYDLSALRSRLMDVSRAECLSMEVWGEGRVRAEHLLTELGRARTMLAPFEALLSSMFLRRVDERGGAPMAAFVTLRKPSGTAGVRS